MHAGANTHRASSNDFEGATPCWAAGRRRRALIAEPRAIHSSNCMALSTAAKRAQPPIFNGGQTWPAANHQRRPNVAGRQLSTAAKRGPPPIINGGQTWPAANYQRQPNMARRQLSTGGQTWSAANASRARQRMRRTLRSLSARSTPELPRRIGTHWLPALMVTSRSGL
jgi:hypothetical protein